NFDSFVGFIFEDICIQQLKSLNKDNKLPFKAKNIGQWWNGREEIDIVALDGKGSFMFCECKWTAKKIGISMLDELQNKTNKFPGVARKYFGFFSKSGFSKGIKDLSEKRKDILLLDY
ncbi:unnamed protein product, partial [marine sediment metagenome]